MAFSRIHKNYRKFLDKGTESHLVADDQRRTRLLNFAVLFSITFFAPIIIIQNLIQGDFEEVIIIFSELFVIGGCLVLNIRGNNQPATLLFLGSLMVTVVLIVFHLQVQSAAPFVCVMISISSTHFLKKTLWQNLFSTLALTEFLVLFIYQSLYFPFVIIEFIPLVVLLILLFLAIKTNEAEHRKYQKAIEEQNIQLRKQQEIIKQQTEEMIAMQEKQHQQTLELKQKDIDMVLASSKMQVQLKENILAKLEAIVGHKSVNKELNRLIIELKSQHETEEKMKLLHQNLNIVNSDFYQRLHEKHPDLSKSERELCVYLRLNLSSKEIAALRNTTDNSINVLKTRLRKKLNLETNAMMPAYLLQI
mgnify:CR=1 FL=1